MADNITLPGAASIVASDDIGGVQYQRVKPSWGIDGVATDVSDATPLPVSDQGVSLLRRIFMLLKPLGVVTGGGSNRLSVDVNSVTGTVSGVTTVTTVTTVGTTTTVGTVNNQAAMGGITAFDLMKAMSRTAYNSGVRSNIS